MIVLYILLIICIIGLLCWVLFTLAVYALPLFVGVTLGLWAHDSGGGVAGSLVAGALAAAGTVIIGQVLFAFARPLWFRLIVAFLFAAPATVAGFATTHGLAKHLIPSEGWLMVFSIMGAIAVGVTALLRTANAASPEIGPAQRVGGA